jgi:hypothetical protein
MTEETLLTSTIIATIGIVGSVVTASLSYFFTKKQKMKMEERRLKEEYYTTYIQALSDAAIQYDNESNYRYAKAFNDLLLIANDKVVELLIEFYDWTRNDNGIDKTTEEWSIKHDEILTRLLKEMRIDLFHSKTVINKIKLMGIGKRQRS